jgi:hypothetical protein
MKCSKCNVGMLEFYDEWICGSCGKRLPLTIISVYGVVNCGGGKGAEDSLLREFLSEYVSLLPSPISNSAPADSATADPVKLTTLIEAELRRLMMEGCQQAPSSQLGPHLKRVPSPPDLDEEGCPPETHLKTRRNLGG